MANEWSWTDSNGTATKEQTESAYNAITRGGSCSKYCCAVWNDLVNLIKSSLDERGLTWLNNYATYEETLVGDKNKTLTAEKFNAVVENIRYPFWSWESNPTSKGYLNRLETKKGDIVFGCYLEDLPKYLNVIIRIYNGTANTYDYTYFEDFTTAYLADNVSLPSSRIIIDGNLDTLSHDSDLVAKPRVLSELKDAQTIVHETKAIARNSNPVRAFHDLRLREFMTLIVVYGQLKMSGELNIDHDIFLNTVASFPISGVTANVNLSDDMSVISAPTEYINADGLVNVTGAGNLVKKVGGNHNADVNINNAVVGLLDALRCANIETNFNIDMNVIGSMSYKRIAKAIATYPITFNTEGKAEAFRSKLTRGNSREIVEINGSAITRPPVYTTGSSDIVGTVRGSAIQKPARHIRGSSENVISIIGNMTRKGLLNLSGFVRVGLNTLGAIGDIPLDPNWSYPKQNGNELYIPQSYHIDPIDNGIRLAWKVPVKFENKLYIPQIFHGDQKDNKLVIIYYSPVKTDNTLYIKQMSEELNGG